MTLMGRKEDKINVLLFEENLIPSFSGANIF